MIFDDPYRCNVYYEHKLYGFVRCCSKHEVMHYGPAIKTIVDELFESGKHIDVYDILVKQGRIRMQERGPRRHAQRTTS